MSTLKERNKLTFYIMAEKKECLIFMWTTLDEQYPSPKWDWIRQKANWRLDIYISLKAPRHNRKLLSSPFASATMQGPSSSYSSSLSSPSSVSPGHPCHLPPPLPPGWQECVSKSTGRSYFWNQHTKKSQWDRPTKSALPQQLSPVEVRALLVLNYSVKD